MRTKLISLWGNQIVRGTSIFFLGNMVANFGGFLYHVILARLLGPVEYGILGSLFGLIYLLSVPMGALDLVVTKLVSGFEPNKILSHTHSLIIFLIRILFKSSPLFLFLLLLSFPIKNFLNLSNIWGIILIWPIIYLWLILIIFRSALKGLLKFTSTIISQIIETFLRVGIAASLFFILPTHISGILGVALASVIAIGITIYQLRPVFSVSSTSFDHHNWPLRSLSVSSLLYSAAFTAMYSIDILLVKHFLSPHLAGIYAVLATAGRIVFFAAAPLGAALIPIISRKAQNPHLARKDLLFTLFLCSCVCIGIIILFSIFPKVIINIMFTSKFLEASQFLPWMGISMCFYSLSNIMSGFLMALGRIRSVFVSLVALLAEIILIWLFHNNLFQVITSLGFTFGILAIILIIYSFYVTSQKTFK